MSWPDLLRTLAREPVIHFLLIGGLLLSVDWAFDRSSATDADDQAQARTTGKPRLIGAETELTSDALKQTERGYDENGEQLFGTAPGEYLILKRVDD